MTEWRWGCIACLMNGAADNVEHAAALGRIHDSYACPATAVGPVQYTLRVARRADLTRRYPGEAPAWKGKRR